MNWLEILMIGASAVTFIDIAVRVIRTRAKRAETEEPTVRRFGTNTKPFTPPPTDNAAYTITSTAQPTHYSKRFVVKKDEDFYGRIVRSKAARQKLLVMTPAEIEHDNFVIGEALKERKAMEESLRRSMQHAPSGVIYNYDEKPRGPVSGYL